MSTILVIEPYKMLQQAFAVALNSDYQVRIQETIPEVSAIKDVDVVIVDAASLGERNAGIDLRAMHTWQVPIVWIDRGDAPDVPSRENLVIVQRPVQNDSLRKALLACLTPAAAPQAPPRLLAKSAARNGSKVGIREKFVASSSDEPRFIELVDVVETPPPSSDRNKIREKK
ncbi:MAG: hypothetical protein ACREQO_24890 [Candidatus Binatia bacterium]